MLGTWSDPSIRNRRFRMLQRCHLIAVRCRPCCGFVTERVDLVFGAPRWGADHTIMMRRDHPSSPFDAEADEAADVTQQFWGSSRGWVSRETPLVHGGAGHVDATGGTRRDDATGSLNAIRVGVRALRPQRMVRSSASGHVERTRQHGVMSEPQASAPRRLTAREASLGELADGWPDDGVDDLEPTGPQAAHEFGDTDDHDLVPLSPLQPLVDRIGLSAVDPLLVRIGMLILIAVLLLPIALALRPDSNGLIEGAITPEIATLADAPLATGAAASDPLPNAVGPVATDSSASVASGSSDPSTAAPAVPADDGTVATSAASPAATSSASVGDVTQAQAAAADEAAAVSAAAERIVPPCPTTYVAGAGDSWYRIADAAGVSPRALLDQNRATVDTVIFPGDDVCLPSGATMPSQLSTPTTSPQTTQPPATTTPTTEPTTTAPQPASQSEVQQIIRDVWPDELEEKALQIARRESNFVATAHNGTCCYGVFQLYWTVHKSWLDDYGIYSSSDLLDAGKNIRAAYALYERAGGWGPWGG